MAAGMKSGPKLKALLERHPELRPQVEEGFHELAEHVRRNPLLRYNNSALAPERVHGKQLCFHRHPRMVRVFVGGNRAGKTACGAVDDLIQVIDRDAVPPHLAEFKIWEPPTYGRIITVDFRLTLQAVQEELRKWCPPDQLRGGSWEDAYRKEDRVLHFANGSFIEFLSQEQERDQHGGTSRHFVHWDEEPRGEKGRALRQENSMRLVEYRGHELFTFTNFTGFGWTYEEFEEGKGEEVERDVWLDDRMLVVRSDMEENPVLDKEEIEWRLEGMPPRERRARKEGKFSHFAGLVYEEFDREFHVVDPIEPKHLRGLELLEGIDPGVDTTAVLFAAIDKHNCILIFDELYLHDSSAIPERTAQLIKEKRKKWGYREPAYTLIDPSAQNRDLVNQDSVSLAYARAGIRAYKAKNDRDAGIFEIRRRLTNARKDGTPEPLLLVTQECPSLIREFGMYRVKDTPDGSFEVVRGNDHALDVAKYICLARPVPGMKTAKPRNRRQQWTPGTAPPLSKASPKQQGGPLGKYS